MIPKYNPDAELLESTRKDNPQEIGGISLEGSGGPDLFGYKWKDSNEPNGPVYVWNDIVSNPNAVQVTFPNGTLDDGWTNAIPLGFNMKFYGTEYSNIYLSTNGFLSFTALTSSYFTNAQIPAAALPNNIIAPFWDDLDGRTQGTVHRLLDGNKLIIQFTNWQNYSGTGSLTFQVVLNQYGKIQFYYNNMNATLNSATGGIENAGGNVGLQVAYNANYVANNLAVQFAAEPEWLTNNVNNGTLFNGNSVDVELTFMAEDYPLGFYSMDFVVTSNDPVAASVTVPITMEITIIPVELTSLTAMAERNNVTLSWATATETNNSGFQVERMLAFIIVACNLTVSAETVPVSACRYPTPRIRA